MQVSTFYEKLNKVDGNTYVVEEEIHLTNGVYEAELQHDNINEATFAVFTGPKLTGTRLETYTLSTPSLAPWKRIVRVYADVPVAYISYETDGDTVEGDDINRVQAAVVETQKALNTEEARALSAEMELNGRIDTEVKRAEDAELTLRNNLASEITRAKAAEKSIGDAVNTHISNKSNPHGVTKSQVGLGSVPNVATNDQVPTFTQATTLDNLTSGEKLTVMLGKIAKAIEDFITHKADAVQHITATERTNWNDANSKKHSHSNKSILDTVTQAMLEKLEGIAEGANKYVHPTTAGNKHIPSGGTSGQILRWSADGTAEWGADSNSDTKVTQTNTTGSANYRIVLSGNANDSTETNTARKSANFWANPATGELYAKGFRRTDITGQTLDINTLNLSSGAPSIMRYIEKSDGGATNITNIPVAGKPFLLDVELIRWVSAADYITMQTFRNAANPANEYVRFCKNGTWNDWTTRVFSDTEYSHPSSGVTAGTYRSVTVNAQGHVTAGTNPTTLAGYGITDAAAKNHNHDITYLKKGAVTWNDLKGV